MAIPLPPDDSVAWKVWLGSVVSVVLATIAVALRLFARKLSAAPFWWDDWTIVASLVRRLWIRIRFRVCLGRSELLTSFSGSAMGHGHFSMDHTRRLLLRPPCCLRGET